MDAEESSTTSQQTTTEELEAEVNQRALIDKVLARYSGEFTLFRELLQNADDAGPFDAESPGLNAEIHFKTTAVQQQQVQEGSSTVSDAKTTKVVQWSIRNDGKPFDVGDWGRLPVIAEGNPNPEKIGAFGVGFYSVFSVTDSPSVSSGGRELLFYWKKNDNQLYIRHSVFPQQDRWTTFKLPLREPRSMSSLSDLVRFLASSITFMVNMTTIGVFIDDDRVGYIQKSRQFPRMIDIPKEMVRSSDKGVMCVNEAESHRITIEVEMKNAKSRVDLTIFTAKVDVKADEKLSSELRRSMKKKPPARLEYSLIYTGRYEYDHNSAGQRNTHPELENIFRGLRVDLEGDKHMRIFIGHATGQTTSIGGHMSSRFIPTVERESIDFVNEYVSSWNEELLYVGGFLCRVVYEEEISDIKHLWEAALTSTGSEQSPSRDDLNRRFLHVLKFFTFHDSTPSSKVAKVLRNSFYSCFHPLRLLSSVGVREVAVIKTFNSRVTEFLDTIPMLSELVAQEAAQIIDRLPYKISSVSAEDVLQALDGHPLSIEKLCSCLRWWLRETKRSGSSLSVTNFLKVVSFTAAGGISRPLSQIGHFLNNIGLGAHIPRDGPLPISLIPINVSKHFNPTDLAKFEWRELTIMDWFRHISQEEIRSEYPTYDFTNSSGWARHVLYTLSRGWSSLPEEDRRSVKAILQKAPSIPTFRAMSQTKSLELRFPEDAHLPVGDDDVYRKYDLPLVVFAGLELDREIIALLSFIGVRQNISEEQAYEMLKMKAWSMSKFIDCYLVPSSSSSKFPILRTKPFPDDASEEFRYRLEELYPPLDIFRQLGLLVIKWDKNRKWLDESEEAKILYDLGLRRYPPLKELINRLCTSPTTSIQGIAFAYLCDNIRSKYSDYHQEDFQDVAFVPAESKEVKYVLKIPGDVFLSDHWKSLGFFVVQNAYQKVIVNELGVRKDPSPSEIIPVLKKTPPSYEEAPKWFEYLSEYQAFTQSNLAELQRLDIVPKKVPDPRKWITPEECYFGQPKNEFYSKLFSFVDFGPKAVRFLSTCGSKEDPSPKDIAKRLIDDPEKFYQLAGTPESFLEKLRDLANRKAHIPNETLYRMTHKQTLLGKRLRRTSNKDEREPVYKLCVPKEIVIIDDPRDYELFGDIVHVAPQDELLERFYSFLGCRRLSTVIRERYEDSPAILDDRRCTEVKALVLQRHPSFLQKCSHYQHNKAHILTTENFRVFACRRILVHKTLMIGDNKKSLEQDLWAVAKCSNDSNEEKIIELWISNYVHRDMYDLAASLCRILFGKVRFTDTVLLGAMLSDLKLLKRAGFDVEQFDEEKPLDLPVDTTPSDAVITHDNHPLASLPADQEHRQTTSTSTFEFIAKAGSRAYRAVKGTLTLSQCPSMTPERRNISRQRLSQNCIQNVVKRAVDACNLGRHQLLSDEEMVEFLKHYSCYDFAQIDNLRSLGVTSEGVAIHVAGDDPSICAFIAGKQELLHRFINVVIPAAASHEVEPKSLHIFYEVSGGPIAFNLDGSIYLNLRYFEDWHDKDVQNNDSRRAILSWFFVLAHEIAHSLIPSHDSAHAFWFSAICENHIDSLLLRLKR